MKCPFTNYVLFCYEKDCNGCGIRVKAMAKINAEIAKNIQAFWTERASLAEK